MFDPYYLWAVLLIVVNGLAWLSNLFTVPGNWIIVALTALFAWFFPASEGPGIAWWTVLALVVLAAVGEIVEFAAGAAGAARRGGSFRGMALAVVGAVVGSIVGATVALPIPFAFILGAIFGGAVGAFAGAYLGEAWKGRATGESIEIGKAAFIGRLLGTAGKFGIGAVIWIVAAIDAFVWSGR